MKNINIFLKQTKGIILFCSILVVFFAALYFSGLLPKFTGINPKQLSYLTESAGGTGLISPTSNIIAMNSNVADSNSFASNVLPGVENKDIAMGDNPIVLFDISAKPGGDRSYAFTPIFWIWVTTGAITLIMAIILLAGYLKRKRIARIKDET